MDYKLKVNFPNMTKGEKIQIAGLDTFENGHEYVISDAEHDNFRRYHGHTEVVYNEKQEIVGSKLVLGPTLLQANIYGIKVETAKESDADKKARKERETQEKQEREEIEANRRNYAEEQDFDLSILEDASLNSWIFDPESSVAQDAEAKLVADKSMRGEES